VALIADALHQCQCNLSGSRTGDVSYTARPEARYQRPQTSGPRGAGSSSQTVHMSPVSHRQCLSVHTGAHQSQEPNVKRLRCPILTGPVRRRQSRWRRPVHRSHAETSIRCSPVRGARAPTEHPNPASSGFMSLWTLCLSRRASGNGRAAKQVPDTAGRRRPHAACQRKQCPRAPTDHP
jgi:hypothetical protein